MGFTFEHLGNVAPKKCDAGSQLHNEQSMKTAEMVVIKLV